MKGLAAISISLVFFRGLWIVSRTFTRVEQSPRSYLLVLLFMGMAIQTAKQDLSLPLLIPGLLVLAAGAVLIEWSAHTVRGKFFSLIGNRDTPQFVLQDGPYAYVRHPFYSSYLLMHLAVAVMFPGIVTSAILLATFVLLWLSAAFEERKFSGSPLAEDYQAYTRRTGRFIPRLRR